MQLLHRPSELAALMEHCPAAQITTLLGLVLTTRAVGSRRLSGAIEKESIQRP